MTVNLISNAHNMSKHFKLKEIISARAKETSGQLRKVRAIE